MPTSEFVALFDGYIYPRVTPWCGRACCGRSCGNCTTTKSFLGERFPMELTASQIKILERLHSRGLEIVAFPMYESAVGVRRGELRGAACSLPGQTPLLFNGAADILGRRKSRRTRRAERRPLFRPQAGAGEGYARTSRRARRLCDRVGRRTSRRRVVRLRSGREKLARTFSLFSTSS